MDIVSAIIAWNRVNFLLDNAFSISKFYERQDLLKTLDFTEHSFHLSVDFVKQVI